MIEELIVKAVVDAVVEKTAEVVDDFAYKCQKKSAAEDHALGLDTQVSPE